MKNIPKYFLMLLLYNLLIILAGCSIQPCAKPENSQLNWNDLKYSHSMDLQYAKNFSVDYYENGYTLITIIDSGKFLLVPENKAVPTDLDAGITVLKQPVKGIYLVATSAMDLFCALDSLNAIRLSGTDAEHWHIPKARAAMENGSILYAGKYNAPDYELILSQECGLAIESTMIYHTPEVKEKLMEFGIPVLVERSSYETHPLGRMEWIQLYGALLGKEDLAQKLLNAQTTKLRALSSKNITNKTVAFFYISNSGYVNVRKPGDYISKMIELAGGKYIFNDLGQQDNSLSTINMQMESFYAAAKNADIIIYNSTIDAELGSLNDLLEKSPLLKDFKAVQSGEVWCTTKNMFQETMSLGDMVMDFHSVIQQEGDNTPLKFLYRLQ